MNNSQKLLPQTVNNLFISGFIIVFFLILLTSCDPCRKLSRGKTLDLKDSAAYCYFQRKNYENASTILEELKALYRTDIRLEKASFYFANCKYYMGQFIMASFYFREFTQTFPASKYTEEATFMVCKSYYMSSLEHQLDQTETYKAIEYANLYLQHYPTGQYIDDVKTKLKELKDKLAYKAFLQANLYYKTFNYHSGVVSFKNVLSDYPDSKYKEEAQFKLFLCSALYAEKSIDAKKEERYLESILYYQKFVDRYPNSQYKAEADKHHHKVQELLKSIKDKAQ